MSAGTAETPEPATSPLDFTTTVRDRPDDEHFTIDGDPLVAHKPKIAVLALMDVPDTAPPIQQMQSVTAWLPHVFDTDSQRMISGRLDDPEDDLDVPDLVALGRRLLEHWSGGRPTGPSGGSRKRSASTTRRSTARST